MAILVCGGAGYIGSHMVAELIENNKEVVILDNFEKGHEDAILGGKLYKGDLRDRKILPSGFLPRMSSAEYRPYLPHRSKACRHHTRYAY